jgi:hypothetical protein
MLAWMADNSAWLGALGVLGIVSLVATVAFLPAALVRIPPDYFRHRRRHRPRAEAPRDVAAWAVLVARNVLGALLVLAGVAMLVLPGQGLITLLVGLMLTSFPGKYSLEKWLVSRPGVLRAINWLRQRAGHAPVLPPADHARASKQSDAPPGAADPQKVGKDGGAG